MTAADDETMRLGGLRAGILIAVFAGLLVLVGVVSWPDFRLWNARRQAMEKYEQMPASDRAALSVVLGPYVKRIVSPAREADQVSCTVEGYRFSLPAGEYRRLADAKGRFESDKLTLACLGPCRLTPESQPAKQAAGDGVKAYFDRADPYDVLVAALNATPGGIRRQDSHEGLRKHLLLLLLKAELLPEGADRLFLRFQTDRRKGILAGDTTLKRICVNVYLPETGQFANLAIFPKDAADMEDVYRCLGQLRIEHVSGPDPVVYKAPAQR